MRIRDLEVREGTLANGLPYYAFGDGAPLVVLRWFTPAHTNPTGVARGVELRVLAPLARHFRVYAVGRAPGMVLGTTMADIAARHAEALRAEFDGPVDVMGLSSGGSVALQMAADHPDVVRALVVAGAAHRLTPRVRRLQRRYTEAVAAGRRGLQHQAVTAAASPAGRALAGALLWLLDPLARPDDPSDMLAFARAEEGFDLTGRLADLVAPTLIIGGEKDLDYPVELFRETAEGARDGRLITYPGLGHLGAFRSRRFAGDVATFLAGTGPGETTRPIS
ncbi:alpha/beta hydrolase [Streptosporangium sp. NBC_01495]|uniref:alpha/beta fold hydrolase n=1 Tax=Streptosporangium sp. NBC_01495 TaxID=2903899 RepID=UPI002E2F7994|nr:alpha/beta hydrolase [Streptosporangium sp. NBC_01495]